VARSDIDGARLLARVLIGFSRRHIDLQRIASCLCCA
jgi:hypothetical protein